MIEWIFRLFFFVASSIRSISVSSERGGSSMPSKPHLFAISHFSNSVLFLGRLDHWTAFFSGG